MAEDKPTKGRVYSDPAPGNDANKTKGSPGKKEDWVALGNQKSKERHTEKKPRF